MSNYVSYLALQVDSFVQGTLTDNLTAVMQMDFAEFLDAMKVAYDILVNPHSD